MKYILSVFVVIIISFNSCKKSTLEDVKNTGSIDSLSYQPSVAGSTWKYSIYLNGVSNSEKTTACQNYDTTFNSKTYDVYQNTNGEAVMDFTRRDGDKYYIVLPTSTNKTELLVLDAAKGLNDTWTGGVNGSDTYYYTITEKLASTSVNNINLKNVIKVSYERKDAAGSVTGSGSTWFAQGVGNYKSEATIGPLKVEYILTLADIK